MTAMKCPVCEGSFKEVNRDGILIDICSTCKGVWLDRGELEKLLSIIQQDADMHQPAARMQPAPEPYRYEKHTHYDDDDRHRHRHQGHYRKKSKLESLFDIFD